MKNAGGASPHKRGNDMRINSADDLPESARKRNADKLAGNGGFLGMAAQNKAQREQTAIESGDKKELSETRIQQELIARKWQHIDEYPELLLLFAIPNGGDLSDSNRMRLVAEGMLSGVYDLYLDLPIWESRVSGLWLECKTPKGQFSKQQRGFKLLREVNSGYRCLEFRSADAGWQHLMNYIAEFRRVGGVVVVPEGYV